MWSFVLHLVASFPGILFCILYFILSAQQCKFHLWPFYLFRQESAAFKGNLVLIFQQDLEVETSLAYQARNQTWTLSIAALVYKMSGFG